MHRRGCASSTSPMAQHLLRNNGKVKLLKIPKKHVASTGVSADDVIADGVVVLRKTKRHNTVLVTQAPPRGASAHARYLAASKISARQDGRTKRYVGDSCSGRMEGGTLAAHQKFACRVQD